MNRAAAAALLALSLAGCRPAPSPPRTAEGAALALFDVAAGGTDAGEVASRLEGGEAPGARSAVRALESARNPRVLGIAPLPGGAVALDLEASLGAGATARYTIHVAKGADGAWRVVAIGGPGVAWPVRPTPAAEGLTESPPPR